MGSLIDTHRFARKSVFPFFTLVGTFTLATTLGFASSSTTETIQATYPQAGNTVSVTLIIFKYSAASDLQILSQAYQEGQDQGLATALSRTQPAGRCLITGAPTYDVAFIQMVQTPTGRRITFITNRPHRFDELDPPLPSGSFDLAVGEFDLNDTDAARSTGFLYPASKLVIDAQGMFHYDLAGNPWPLVNVLDSYGIPA
jgi:hypothetical protein